MPRCPNCFSPLTRVEQDGIKSISCSSCFGTCIADIALLRRVRRDAATPAAGTPSAPSASLADLAEVVSASDSKVTLRCPQCEKPMIKDRFHPMIPVQIDRCKPCGYVWLDAGELSLIRQLYIELMTSDDPEIVRRRDQVATAMSAWDSRRTGQTFGPDDFFSDGFDILTYFLRRVSRI
jgi:Zn-finger nucleic acid-binding protein